MGASCFMGLGFFSVQDEASKMYPMHGYRTDPFMGHRGHP